MEHLKNSIVKTIQLIEDNTTLFYQQKNQEGFQNLNNTLNTLMQVAGEIQVYHADKSDKILDDQIFNTVLTEAIKAMEQKDTILLADILIYEVNDMLEECLQRI